MRSHLRGVPAPDARALIALLLLTLVLSGLLAFEAEQEVGAHREASARVLREHLAATGRDALDATALALRQGLADALGAAVDVRAATPFDPVPSPTLLEARANRLVCTVPSPTWIRLDLRDGSFAEAGGDLPAAVRAWVGDAARALGRAGVTATDGGYAVVAGRGAAAGRIAALGVKRAPFDAPVAVYGLVTCDDVLGGALLGAARRTGAAGDALSLALADSLLAIEVRDASGALLARTPARVTAQGAAAPVVAERRVAGLTLRAFEGPGAAHRLPVAERRRTRVVVVGTLAALTGALGVLTLRQLRREQELVRLRADFTSSVSHELRTPLAQILLYGETLALGRTRDAAQQRAAADTIVREARRLMHMVENVLHAARAERRGNPVRVAPVSLAPLVHDVVRGFAPLAGTAGMDVAAEVPDLVALAEPDALRQVLLNLLDNALRYGARPQTIRVGATAEGGGTVRLWVDDAGPGIPARDRRRVWLPFVRLSRDREAGDRTGSGLGLAVVADLVVEMRGEAWIGDAPGGGTRVSVRLPAAPAREGVPAPTGAPAAEAIA